ncbi:MAG TPA: formyltransferase family protein [Longimicrobiaceae bacterium]|nr:formyltransferase family protein [Longimicrobiaceae bacterium]
MPVVVLITNDSMHGRRVLQSVWERGIVLDAVLFLTGSLGLPPARGTGFAGRLRRWPAAVATAVARRVRFATGRRRPYAERCGRVIATGGMNSGRLLRDLRRLRPDWIVLGGGGILSPQVIATARMGVLNAHPALLPWIRGCGTTGASLVHGVALGATVHRVDAGIDTGAIVRRRLLPVAPGDTHLGDLEQGCMRLASTMLADAVEAIVRRDDPQAGVPQPERYPLFRTAREAELREHFAIAASGRAHALYRAWLPLCPDPEDGILPSSPVAAPQGMEVRPAVGP